MNHGSPGESFVRWQGITREQLGFVTNLILGLATAALGFSFNLVKDKDFPSTCCWGRVLLAQSMFILLVSIITGIVCTINRLSDFRITMSIARDRERWKASKTESEIDRKLSSRRKRTKKLGKRTWRIFCWQMATFTSGTSLQFVALGIIYHVKLCV
jgi:hypothetical protein